MQNNNTVGRPRIDGLETVVKFKTSFDIAEKLDILSDEENISRSELLRKETEYLISSKNYENMCLSKTNVKKLQELSEKCWNELHTPGCAFIIKDFSERMPAFLTSELAPVPMVYVKYPSYRIQILKNTKKSIDDTTKDIKDILKEIPNLSDVYINNTFIVHGISYPANTLPFTFEVATLAITLEENEKIKSEAVRRLNEKGYNTCLYVSYSIRGARVSIDGDYFTVITD